MRDQSLTDKPYSRSSISIAMPRLTKRMLIQEAMTENPPESRAEQRTNMFVLATIASASASGSVKIRNMSPSGALIEGAALPATGEQVQLSRGATSVRGHVAWSAGGKADILFAGQVEVSQWTPGGSSEQERVNRIVQQAKAAVIPIRPDQEPDSDGTAPTELAKLARSLDALADALADDPGIVSRFGIELQTLDIASQVLRKLARRPSSG